MEVSPAFATALCLRKLLRAVVSEGHPFVLVTMQMTVSSLMIVIAILACLVPGNTGDTEKPSIDFGTVIKGTFVPRIVKVKVPLWDFPGLESGQSEACTGFHVRVKPEDCDATGTALEISPLEIRVGVLDRVPVGFGLTGGRSASITASANIISDISVDRSHFDFSSVPVRHRRSQSMRIRGPADFRVTGIPECIPGMSFTLKESHTDGTSVSILTLSLADEFDGEFQGFACIKCSGLKGVSEFPLYIDCPPEVELSGATKVTIHDQTNDQIVFKPQRLSLQYGARIRGIRSRLFASAFSAVPFSGKEHCYVKSQVSAAAARFVKDGTTAARDTWIVELVGGREVPIEVVYDFRHE